MTIPRALSTDFPVVVEPPDARPEAVTAWLRECKAELAAALLHHGAIRFKGIGVDSPETLGTLSAILFDGAAFGYAGGDSPRTRLSDRVYTSTEFPAEYAISLHNELSYAARWPAQVLFCCAVPSSEGGETPIVDSRALLGALDPCLVDEFERRRVTYIRNLHDGTGFGRSWQATFETRDRSTVERICAESGAELHWSADGGAHVRQTRPALATHPTTGERVWFNQADQFHPSTYPRQLRDALIQLYGDDPERLPSYATFGDGTPIPVSALDAIRTATANLATSFPWERGDALWLDNMLAAHGRNPYTGPRRILVALG